jgi:hypothetical protein
VKAPQIALDPRAAELLREAQDWRTLGLLFERPRDPWRQDVARLAEACDDAALREAGALAGRAEEGRYLALFGPGGALSPRETGFRRSTDPARTIAELRAFHAAFAFEARHEDPIDHLSVLCDFVAWLRLKEAYATASGDREATEVTHEAAERFVRTHLAPCAEPLALSLAEFDSGHLLPAARALLARTGPRPVDVEGDWVPQGLAAQDCSITCALGGAALEPEPVEQELPPEFTAGLPREF